jgi:hypothetical protein
MRTLYQVAELQIREESSLFLKLMDDGLDWLVSAISGSSNADLQLLQLAESES